MGNQKKNIYRELPKDIREEIGDKAKEEIAVIMLERLKTDNTVEVIQLLKQALFNSLTSHKSDIWFKDKAHQEDLKLLQEKYDKEIAILNEVIQRKAL